MPTWAKVSMRSHAATRARRILTAEELIMTLVTLPVTHISRATSPSVRLLVISSLDMLRGSSRVVVFSQMVLAAFGRTGADSQFEIRNTTLSIVSYNKVACYSRKCQVHGRSTEAQAFSMYS